MMMMMIPTLPSYYSVGSLSNKKKGLGPGIDPSAFDVKEPKAQEPN